MRYEGGPMNDLVCSRFQVLKRYKCQNQSHCSSNNIQYTSRYDQNNVANVCSVKRNRQKGPQKDINGHGSYRDTRYSPHQHLRVSQKRKTPGDAMNRPKTNTYPKHYGIGYTSSSVVLVSAQNLGTWSSRLRTTSRS